MRRRVGASLLGTAIAGFTACGQPAESPAPAPVPPSRAVSGDSAGAVCPGHDPRRAVFWGDLHVHTALSGDAWMFDTRTTPDDAYRFATGEPVRVRPLDESGEPTFEVRIDRPLDFAAVTDHAETLGSVALCVRPGSPIYDAPACRTYRGESGDQADFEGVLNVVVAKLSALGREEVCGADRERCREAMADPWRETREAAERWNAPCEFTTFQAYEYSWSPELAKVHRNVIFRNEVALDLPISSVEEPEVEGLWRRLRDECLRADNGCDVLAIPHNPNLSNGRMFAVEYGEAATPEEQAAVARLRAEVEPLVEMMQLKGESECRSGMWQVFGEDENCGFEKFRDWPEPPEDCRDGYGGGALMGRGCISRLDFARYALIEGLRERARIGVNPYKLGFIGSTDIHEGTPGDVAEWAWDGVRRPAGGSLRDNPGGLMGVWAEENTRDALFDAMRRRETFATSGTRIAVRLLAGWDLPEDPCAGEDLAGVGDGAGVPMGADLPAASGPGGAPRFAVSALRDPGTSEQPGTPLQSIQIVKGWVGKDGGFHQAVVEIARAASDADVDLERCTPRGGGADALCGSWRDPDFDPERDAVYYARVLEGPSCRYSTRLCRNLQGDARPADCDDPRVPATIQERAWTSPVWYRPDLRAR